MNEWVRWEGRVRLRRGCVWEREMVEGRGRCDEIWKKFRVRAWRMAGVIARKELAILEIATGNNA
jgi:hypothetical protein